MQKENQLSVNNRIHENTMAKQLINVNKQCPPSITRLVANATGPYLTFTKTSKIRSWAMKYRNLNRTYKSYP